MKPEDAVEIARSFFDHRVKKHMQILWPRAKLAGRSRAGPPEWKRQIKKQGKGR